MFPFLPLLPCKSSVSMIENSYRQKKKKKAQGRVDKYILKGWLSARMTNNFLMF